jgi:hypothetical protein
VFEDMSKEQQDAWRSKVRAVDAALKVVQTTPAAKPARRLHLVPSLTLLHSQHERKTAAA